MKRWTNGLPGATKRLGAMMALRGLSASQPRMRADTHDGPEQIAPLQRPDTLMQLSRSLSWKSILYRTAGPYILARSGGLLHVTKLVASLIGRLGQALFRLSTTPVSMSLTGSRFSSDSAPRPFHHGDSKTRWNNLLGGLAVSVTAGPSDQTNSPHPSSREGHHSTAGWSSISSYRI
jgi:hypothetical protein